MLYTAKGKCHTLWFQGECYTVLPPPLRVNAHTLRFRFQVECYTVLPPPFTFECRSRVEAVGPWRGCLTRVQGLTLVHFSAQRKRFLWDRGCT